MTIASNAAALMGQTDPDDTYRSPSEWAASNKVLDELERQAQEHATRTNGGAE